MDFDAEDNSRRLYRINQQDTTFEDLNKSGGCVTKDVSKSAGLLYVETMKSVGNVTEDQNKSAGYCCLPVRKSQPRKLL
jgi:hypothetical protein